MKIDFGRVKTFLQEFRFKDIFIEELGWSDPRGLNDATFTAKGVEMKRHPIAVLGGFVVFEVRTTDGLIPDSKVREAAHKVVGGHHHEHVLVFVDGARRKSVWSWVLRKDGRDHPRTHYYFHGQPGDLFIGKLDALMFDLSEFDAEGNVSIVEVSRHVRAALDVAKVTKKFFTDFQAQHGIILDLVDGIPNAKDRRWYVSVLLNRLMFIYFLQKKGFLDRKNDKYLQKRLDWSRATLGADQYFDGFLKLLFFEGFAKPEKHRSKEANARLGYIRYLNGGLFLPHRIEQENPGIAIPDIAFEGLFDLFESYTWHLDDTPGGKDDTINPDVLGYIFEKYINQKSSGAYYTRPEITDWLCEQTIDRVVLDRINLPASLVTNDGSPSSFDNVADLRLHLTPSLCRQLLLQTLPSISLLDPACGSGAFLVAALKAMLNLYGSIVGAAEVSSDASVKEIVTGWKREHSSLGYFLKKKIITENLYGVDLMEEATEIARLRLFLALVSSATTEADLEPLPNIDFNIMPGNSLVGLLRVDDAQVDRTRQSTFGYTKINYRKIVDDKNRLIDEYRDTTKYGEGLVVLRDKIEAIKSEARTGLNNALLEQFWELKIKFEQPTWNDAKNDVGKSKKRLLELADIVELNPFHWGFEFDDVMERKGGFDAILANPPWEAFKPNSKEFFNEYSNVITKNNMRIEDFEKEQKKLLAKPEIRKAWLEYLARFPHVSEFYRSAPQYEDQISLVAGKKIGTDTNLYKLFVEQCLNLLRPGGQLGLVVPGALYADLGTMRLRESLFDDHTLHTMLGLSNERYIFEAVHHSYKICLLVATKGGSTQRFNAAFRINPREAVAVDHLAAFLRDRNEHIELTPALVRVTSSGSLSIMEFKSSTDVAIVKKILQHPLLRNDVEGGWKLEFTNELHMTSDSDLFKTSPSAGRIPLYEGKMIHQYEAHFSEPRYWVEAEAAAERLMATRRRRYVEGAKRAGAKTSDDAIMTADLSHYLLSFRAIARNTDERTMIATVIPPGVVTGHSLSTHIPTSDVFANGKHREQASLSPKELLYVAAALDSYVVDWVVRMRVASNISMFYVYQLPVPRLTEADPRLSSIATRAAKLTCTGPEFDGLAKAAGLKNHKSGVTDPEKRAQLRAEIDGLVAHLYGLTEQEFAHILLTFPVVTDPVREAARNAYRAVARGDVT